MPGRITPLVNNEFYHIYNRGSEKKNIFIQPRDYRRLKQTFFYYQFLGAKQRFSNFSKSKINFYNPISDTKIVEIISFCLMPNHFHFLIRQLKEGGISIFMSKLSNSYTKFFNIKYSRIGPLLQGAFKAVLIEKDEQLIHTSRYIHLNPVVSGITKDLTDYPWSSYFEYLQETGTICNIKPVMDFFSSVDKYKEFVQDQADYGTSLELLKHQIFEEEV